MVLYALFHDGLITTDFSKPNWTKYCCFSEFIRRCVFHLLFRVTLFSSPHLLSENGCFSKTFCPFAVVDCTSDFYVVVDFFIIIYSFTSLTRILLSWISVNSDHDFIFIKIKTKQINLIYSVQVYCTSIIYMLRR